VDGRDKPGHDGFKMKPYSGHMTKDLVLVGKFGAAHGIKGEVRLQSFTGVPSAIGTYGPLFDQKGRAYKLAHLRAVKGDLFVARVEGLKSRTDAEALTNVELFVPRAALPSPEEDEFYLSDLIGLSAYEGEDKLGTIIDVLNFGGGDILEIAPQAGGETLLLPFTKEIVPEIDLAQRRVLVVMPDEIEGEEEGENTAISPSESSSS